MYIYSRFFPPLSKEEEEETIFSLSHRTGPALMFPQPGRKRIYRNQNTFLDDLDINFTFFSLPLKKITLFLTR